MSWQIVFHGTSGSVYGGWIVIFGLAYWKMDCNCIIRPQIPALYRFGSCTPQIPARHRSAALLHIERICFHFLNDGFQLVELFQKLLLRDDQRRIAEHHILMSEGQKALGT